MKEHISWQRTLGMMLIKWIAVAIALAALLYIGMLLDSPQGGPP
jgi:hypothetical protein